MNRLLCVTGLLLLCTLVGCAAPPGAPPATLPPDSPGAFADAPDLTPLQQIALVRMDNHGAAPELTNELWINAMPLRLTDLRGQVVIVEFWTYG